MLFVLTNVLVVYLSVFCDYELSLCLSSVEGRPWTYLSRKALFGGHARSVVGRASGIGWRKNSSLRTYSMVSLCLGSF